MPLKFVECTSPAGANVIRLVSIRFDSVPIWFQFQICLRQKLFIIFSLEAVYLRPSRRQSMAINACP